MPAEDMFFDGDPGPVSPIRPEPLNLRCGICGGRTKRDTTKGKSFKKFWIQCRNGCYWSSCDSRHNSFLVTLRLILGR